VDKRLCLAAAPLLLAACSALDASPRVAAAVHPGRPVYEQHCAQCHDHPDQTRAPAVATLEALGFRGIRVALTDGAMKTVGSALSTEEQIAVAGFLNAGEGPDKAWIAAHTCKGARRSVKLDAAPTVASFGIDDGNERRLSAEASGLSKAQLAKLDLAWAIGFPGNVSLRAQPAVVGDQLFISTPEAGQLFALDIAGTPCVEWVYEPGVPLRSAVTFGALPSGRKVLAFSDGAVREHLLDAATGKEIWTTSVALGTVSNATAAPALHGDRLYAPVSAGEINIGANPKYECCRSHGGVVALDAATGAKLWEMHTMQAAAPTRVSRVGTQLWGPSGAPIWNTPAIDGKRGQLYIGTGENTSAPATDTSDSVMAIALADGAVRWKFQATRNDIFLTGCMTDASGPNCPSKDAFQKDYDFGASIMLTKRSDGSDIVLAGQKSGVLWALDPDTGRVLWSVDAGPGGPAGGIHWGLATDGKRVFAATNRAGAPGEDQKREPGLVAVDIDTGKVVWSVHAAPDCSGDRRTRIPSCDRAYGFSAAPLVVDGAVVQGGLDGLVRILDGETGALIWSYDTARPFGTANGVPARGGSIDNATIVAANGLLLVGSGYGLASEQPGNVLLAFKPR
jgi:polyvinyl alcohol dehydrogenase (cytochrome)